MKLHCDDACAEYDECPFGHDPTLCWKKALDSELALPISNTRPHTERGSMVVTMKDLGYELRPYQSGLCYELFKWREAYTVAKGKAAGKRVDAGWVSTGRYPGNLAEGLRTVFDFTLMEDKFTYTLDEAVKKAEAVRDSIALAEVSA